MNSSLPRCYISESVSTCVHTTRAVRPDEANSHTYTLFYLCLVEIGDIGATGRLTFRQDGRRRGYIVEVLGLGRRGLEQVRSHRPPRPGLAGVLTGMVGLVLIYFNFLTLLSYKYYRVRYAICIKVCLV